MSEGQAIRLIAKVGWKKAEFRKILKSSCLRKKVLCKPSCSEASQQHALWERWQEGLQHKFTLPQKLPPLRMLLVLDNLTGHKTAERWCSGG